MTALLLRGLSGTALCLCGVVAYQALAPVSPVVDSPARATPPRSERHEVFAAYQPPPESQFAIINARPLFDPARQPVAEAAQSGTANLSPPDLSLVGVAIGSQNSVALFKKSDGRPAISAQLGQMVDGWQLTRIEPGFVVFRANATDYTLKLRAASGLPQPTLNNVSPPVVTEQPGR